MNHDPKKSVEGVLPFRLLDCFGFPVASAFETAAGEGFADVCDPLFVFAVDLVVLRRTVGE